MSVVAITDADFKTMLDDNAEVVVKYFADWCGSCRLFSPKYKRLSTDERFKNVLFLDVDAERNPEARHMGGVNSLPFFAVFKNGELVKGDATSKEEVVVSMIESIL